MVEASMQVLNAATLISLLILISMGLGIILGLMGIINLAHGELVTIGAYALVVSLRLGGSFWIALVLAPLLGAVVGILIERGLIRFLYARPLDTILATWGLSLVLQQLIQFAFGAGPQIATSPLHGSLSLFGVSYPWYRLFIIAAGPVVIASAAYVFLKTDFGLTVRAIFQNREMAAAVGIDTDRVNMLSFAIGSALAALGGVLLAPLVSVVPQMGVNYLATAFFAVLVGGAGSLLGVAAGSTFMGGVQTAFGTFASQPFAQAAVLALAIILVRFRPMGLFGRKAL